MRDESEELVEKLLKVASSSTESKTEHLKEGDDDEDEDEDSVGLLEAIVKHSVAISVLPLLVDCRRYAKQVDDNGDKWLVMIVVGVGDDSGGC